MVRFDAGRYTNLDLIDNESNEIPCVFCLSPVVDEVVFNQLLKTKEGTAAHFNCLIFSPGMKQADCDLVGIYGFTEQEIAKEVRRAKKLRCSYCHKSGATIGCCDLKCKVKFHYACGEAHGVNYDFSGSQYKSFCKNHSPAPFVPAKLNLNETLFCPICIEGYDDRRSVIKSSCCTQAIFHKRCLQMSANQAGYFFKCPMCKDETVFLNDVKRQGVYVPLQDAEWEYEPDAYRDLLRRYRRCDAKLCRCPKGPNYSSFKGEWKIVRCNTCGAAGIHRRCGNLELTSPWRCLDCAKVVGSYGHTTVAGTYEDETIESLQDSSSVSDQPLPAIPGTSRGCLNPFFTQDARRSSTSKRHVSSDGIEGEELPKRAKSTSHIFPNPKGSRVEAIIEKVTKRRTSQARVAKPKKDTKRETSQKETAKQKKTTSKRASQKKVAKPKSNASTTGRGSTKKLAKLLEAQPVERIVYFAPECRDYFPHTREQIKLFSEKTGVIPDWRMLSLQVELVDVFSVPVSAAELEASAAQAQQMNDVKPKVVKQEAASVKRRTTSKDKKYSRKGQWKYGKIKRKYYPKKTEATQKEEKKAVKVEDADAAEGEEHQDPAVNPEIEK